VESIEHGSGDDNDARCLAAMQLGRGNFADAFPAQRLPSLNLQTRGGGCDASVTPGSQSSPSATLIGSAVASGVAALTGSMGALTMSGVRSAARLMSASENAGGGAANGAAPARGSRESQGSIGGGGASGNNSDGGSVRSPRGSQSESGAAAAAAFDKMYVKRGGGGGYDAYGRMDDATMAWC
jgi:hypothetical protein